MYSIGIDAHKRYAQITIMRENGKIINRCKVNNDRKSIKRALRPYAQDSSKAVLESGWDWGLLYNMLNDCDLEVKIAHPLKVKDIAEAKKKGSNSAKVATARRLLKVVYQVWKGNRFYRIESSRTALLAS